MRQQRQERIAEYVRIRKQKYKVGLLKRRVAAYAGTEGGGAGVREREGIAGGMAVVPTAASPWDPQPSAESATPLPPPHSAAAIGSGSDDDTLGSHEGDTDDDEVSLDDNDRPNNGGGAGGGGSNRATRQQQQAFVRERVEEVSAKVRAGIAAIQKLFSVAAAHATHVAGHQARRNATDTTGGGGGGGGDGDVGIGNGGGAGGVHQHQHQHRLSVDTLNLAEIALQTPPPTGYNPLHVYAVQGKARVLDLVRVRVCVCACACVLFSRKLHTNTDTFFFVRGFYGAIALHSRHLVGQTFISYTVLVHRAVCVRVHC